MTATAELLELDRRHVWHPFTPQQEWESEPQLVVESAEGLLLVDTDGRRYIDGVSSLWVTVFGHRVPELDAAVREQLGRVAHSTLLGLGNVPSIRLAARLADFLPAPLRRVFFSDNGSTSVEIAVKMACQFCRQNGRERRTKFVAFTEAYHGDTLGSVSLGGIELFHGTFRPLLFGVHRAPYPHCFRCPLGEAGDPQACGLRCAREFERLLERHGQEIAGCVIEPLVQGAAGMAMAPAGFLRAVAEACRRHGVLLIADEVATGVCRTGPFLACRHEDVVPDFVCLAKGLTGGYLPLAVTVTTEELYRGFLGPRELGRTFFHGHTYTGNPLAAAAALATLDLIAARDLSGHVERLGPDFDRLLAPLRAHPLVGDVRRRGVLTGIELVADRATNRPFDPALRVGVRVCLAARRHGAIVRPIGDVVILNPPPAIEPATLQALVAAVSRAIDDVAAELRSAAPSPPASPEPASRAAVSVDGAPGTAGQQSGSGSPPEGRSRSSSRRASSGGQKSRSCPIVGAPRWAASEASGPSAPAGALGLRPSGSGRRGSPTGAGSTSSSRRTSRLPRKLLITGTDTGVGKTMVAALVARAFRAAGLRVAACKPVESGAPARPDGSSDGERLAWAAGDARGPERITAYRLRAAVAPTAAAEAEGVTLDPQRIRACVREALDTGDAAVVEGAGGLLVPLAPGLTARGLAAELDLPLLIVVADRLGCVNHALLTLEAARAAACAVCGFALCRTTAGDDASRATNRALLERLSGVPVLFEVPHVAESDLREGFDRLVQRVRVPV